MESLQGVNISQSECFPKIHYKEQNFYGHHESGLITWQHHFVQALTSKTC